MRGAFCVVLGKLPCKLGEPARILEFERDTARAMAVGLRYRSGTLPLELRGEIA